MPDGSEFQTSVPYFQYLVVHFIVKFVTFRAFVVIALMSLNVSLCIASY